MKCINGAAARACEAAFRQCCQTEQWATLAQLFPGLGNSLGPSPRRRLKRRLTLPGMLPARLQSRGNQVLQRGSGR